MSETNYHSKNNKNVKGLFSVVCLCVIALGLIVYFSATSGKTAEKNNAVNENQTLEITTEVQRAVTVTQTEKATESQTSAARAEKKEKKTEKTTMEQGENNTPYKSFYKYPLSEAVSKGYSEELVYDDIMGDYRAHAAVDFKGNGGDAVVAINDGLVLDVYKDSMLGNVVVIDHGGKLVAKYCGVENVSVKKGKYVNIGNKLGTLGEVPCEGEEAHLHFETTLSGKPVNPLDVMGKTE